MTFQELYNKYNPILGPNGTRSITGALVNEFITDLKSVFTLQQEQIETVKTAVTGSTSLGTITTSSTIPAEGNVWGFAGEGTYPNAGNITVEAGKFAILSRVGTTWSKVEVSSPKGADGKTTEVWTAKNYVAGSTVYHNGNIWENVSPATSADKPSEQSLIWEQRIKTIEIATEEDGFFITDENKNIAFKVDENGETSFNQNEENLRTNLEPLGLDKAFGNIGSAGEIYFCDINGYVGVKITADGKFESAELGNVTAGHVADIARKILSTNGRELSDYNHIITYGQSLSVGQTEKVISATQTNPNLLNFDGVTRTSAYDKSLTGDTYPTNRRISLQSLVERTNDGTSAGLLRETPSTGTAEMFAKSYASTLYKALDKKIIVSAPGWGATTIADLSKGGAYYQQLIDDVTAGKNLTTGHSYRVLAVTWTQGENDYLGSNTTSAYKTSLKQLATDLNADIKSITGQTEDVILVCYQLATAMNASKTYPNIAMAIHEASKEDSRIYVATPMYHMQYNDGFHLNSASSKLLGAYYGDVINRIIMKGEDWKPLHIKSAVVSGNNITLNYHLPDNGTLVFDTPNGLTVANKGFTFSDGANIITAVNIGADGKSVVINCSASPAGKVLQYAVIWQQVTNAKLNIGNIRDDAGENRRMTIDGTERKLHNYAITQEIQL